VSVFKNVTLTRSSVATWRWS